MLVSKNAKICVTLNTIAKVCVTPNANPQRKQVEYSWRWVPNERGWHVHFMLFVSILFALGSQRERDFQFFLKHIDWMTLSQDDRNEVFGSRYI